MKLKNLALSVVCLASLGTLVGCQSSSSSDKSDSSSAASNDEKSDDNEVHSANADGAVLHTIYFDFDKYDIRADQEKTALEMANSLKKTPHLSVQIQGHTDDRGSVEYNMALGNRRALSLKKFLVTSGVKASKISTISYGKERPAVDGQNEDSWAKNRRDEVVAK